MSRISSLKNIDSPLAWEVGAINTYSIMSPDEAPTSELLYHVANVLARLTKYPPGKERTAVLTLLRSTVPQKVWDGAGKHFMRMYQEWADNDTKVSTYTPTQLAASLQLLGVDSQVLRTITGGGSTTSLTLQQAKERAVDQLRKAQSLFGINSTQAPTSTPAVVTPPVNKSYDEVLDF